MWPLILAAVQVVRHETVGLSGQPSRSVKNTYCATPIVSRRSVPNHAFHTHPPPSLPIWQSNKECALCISIFFPEVLGASAGGGPWTPFHYRTFRPLACYRNRVQSQGKAKTPHLFRAPGAVALDSAAQIQNITQNRKQKP